MRLRVARHTSNLERISGFYQEALGLKVPGSFEDYEEYDGVFLGVPGENLRLESPCFRTRPTTIRMKTNLLVFYVPGEQYPAFVEKVCRAGATELPAKNPYKNNNGTTFADPDGFRFVISKIQ